MLNYFRHSYLIRAFPIAVFAVFSNAVFSQSVECSFAAGCKEPAPQVNGQKRPENTLTRPPVFLECSFKNYNGWLAHDGMFRALKAKKPNAKESDLHVEIFVDAYKQYFISLLEPLGGERRVAHFVIDSDARTMEYIEGKYVFNITSKLEDADIEPIVSGVDSYLQERSFKLNRISGELEIEQTLSGSAVSFVSKKYGVKLPERSQAEYSCRKIKEAIF